MNRYPIRVAKYAIYLIILFFVIFGLLHLVGYSKNVSILDMLVSQQGAMLLGAVILFALLYPFFGFMSKTLLFDTTKRVEEVERVMAMCGYKRAEGDSPEAMIFLPSGVARNLQLLYEGELTITTVEGVSIMKGPRREVTRAYFRMGTYIS